MNEVSSFCVGSCGTDKYFDNPVHPPFEVGNSPTQYPLGFDKSNSSEWKSISSSIAATASQLLLHHPHLHPPQVQLIPETLWLQERQYQLPTICY